MLHLLLGQALATEVTCTQVVELAEVGVAPDDILGALGSLDLSESEARCIVENGSVPDPVRAWAREHLPEDAPPETSGTTSPRRAELDCAEVVSLVGMGLPTSAVLDAVKGLWITEETLGCLQASELPEELSSWATARVTEQERELEQEREAAERAAQLKAEQAEQPAPEIDPLIQAQRDRDRARSAALGPAEVAACLEAGPSPTEAVLLSAFVGFGAGHYAAGNPGRGFAFTVLESAALGGTIGGAAAMAGSIDAEDPVTQFQRSMVLFYLSAGALSAVRVTDTIMAGQTAREARQERLADCK